jgi:hypothetical protein
MNLSLGLSLKLSSSLELGSKSGSGQQVSSQDVKDLPSGWMDSKGWKLRDVRQALVLEVVRESNKDSLLMIQVDG